MKPKLDNVTLCAIDCTSRAHLAVRALDKSLQQITPAKVKLLTHDQSLKYAEVIPKFNGLHEYSRFCIRDLKRYIDTPYVLLVQYDGYVLNGAAWNQEFLNHDYIGSPWIDGHVVGNGGFSLRSKRLLEVGSQIPGSEHPEDCFLCRTHRPELQKAGIRFAPFELANKFSVEGVSWHFNQATWKSDGRYWQGQFGFHSYLTPLPRVQDRPLVFHHSGDLGDIIYSLAVIKTLGGGVLFLSDDNRHPYPARQRVRMDPEVAGRMTPFFEMQDYIWQSRYTNGVPQSCDVDLNSFREFYRTRNVNNFDSLFNLHLKAFNLTYPEDKPWLTVDEPHPIHDKPIIVNRTARYQNNHFPWADLVRLHGSKMVFVGTEHEWQVFQQFGKVDYIKTPDVSELARVIAGAKVFIGNQSTPMAIALGLGKNVIQECWQGNPNCLFKRNNAIYFGVDTVDPNLQIPKSWLT